MRKKQHIGVMLYRSFLLFLFCALLSCSNNETPTEQVYFQESWSTFQVGGSVDFSVLQCFKGKEDPNLPSRGIVASPGASWAILGDSKGSLAVQNNTLHISSTQTAGDGYAILNPKQFPKETPVVVETTIDLKEHPGAWIGLALIQDESDYREFSLRWSGGTLYSVMYAPCFVEVMRQEIPGPKKIKIIYQPTTGFEFYVDGILVYFEPITNNGAEFVGPFYLGIYVVNIEAEAGIISSGIVEATVGEIVVSEF